MVARSAHRQVPPSLVTGVLAVTLAACSEVAGSPAAGTVGVPSSLATGAAGPSFTSAPSPSVGPLEAIAVDTLLAEVSSRDGQLVAVEGDVLADQESAQLCLSLDVAPEIHCDPRILLTGAIPAETLASLEFYRARNLWYGYVIVVGTFHALGADGQPTIEIHQIGVPRAAFPKHPDGKVAMMAVAFARLVRGKRRKCAPRRTPRRRGS